MDSITSTDDLHIEVISVQENLLLDIVKEVSCESGGKLSSTLKGKVKRIIADCDLTHHASLHKLSTTTSLLNESTSTLLGFMNQMAAELTFDEQAELNQAIIHKIQNKLPKHTADLELLRQQAIKMKPNKDQVKELQESLDQKLDTLQEQENEKVELMMEWLNHRIRDVCGSKDNTSELLTLKTRILDLKSKILHLQILLNIFTETNQSIKAYSEIHKDLKESIKETECRIKSFRQIIDNDYC